MLAPLILLSEYVIPWIFLSMNNLVFVDGTTFFKWRKIFRKKFFAVWGLTHWCLKYLLQNCSQMNVAGDFW